MKEFEHLWNIKGFMFHHFFGQTGGLTGSFENTPQPKVFNKKILKILQVKV